MAIPYIFHSQLVMRTPQLAFQPGIVNEEIFLQQTVNDAPFLEALYLASPVLHTELIKYNVGQITNAKTIKKLTLSVAKYHLRMCSRCTPFGLFSGCSVVQWGNEATSILVSKDKLDRHTRFDMHYLCALAEHIAKLPSIKKRLHYFPNSALYAIAEEMRYVEYNYQSGHRKHIISSILASDYAIDILQASQTGLPISSMVARLIRDDITEAEAEEFINDMIEAQVLVNELEPSVTGPEFLYQLITTLKKVNEIEEASITEIITTLEHVEQLLQNIDANNCNEIDVYREIIESLKKFEVPFEENKLFQTDLNFILKENIINATHQTEIMEALTMINLLNKQQDSANLTSFVKRFYERYESAEIPLLEALDNETGIGYLNNEVGNITPLLTGMAIGKTVATESQLPWAKKDAFLFNKLLKAITSKDYTIALEAKEVEDFKNDWNLLPPSLSVMFRLLDDDKILLENSGSSSAINLLGRFAHGNKAIHEIIKGVVQEENAKNPSVIFAEIVHLPESRIGNILLHPAFRQYEIPFLSKSSVPADQQIALQDLYISIKNNGVILRSKKLNKIIIPRLSSAHNYSHRALPVYQFLADMQLQGRQGGIYFTWGALESQYKFLPRLMHKNIIINATQWNFSKQDIASLVGKEDELLMEAVKSLKEQWQLPDLIVLADGDNELMINLNDPLMVEVWLDAVKKRTSFIVKEFLGGSKISPVRDEHGGTYTNQFIAILLRTTPAYNMPALPETNSLKTTVQQDFPIGTSWVYYKLYCGYKTADTVLQAVIYPLVKKILQENVIDSFFFIRYSDPNFHLRLRFHLVDIAKLGTLLHIVQEHLQPFLQQRLIWNIQNDTYKRELSRYGEHTIEQAEHLFYQDSMAVLAFLELTEGDSREDLRWVWAIRAIDEWLNAFHYTMEQKFALLQQIKDSFHTEFKADKSLKEQLSNKYRKHKAAIEEIMDYKLGEANELFPLIEILNQKSRAIQPVVLALQQLEKEVKIIPGLQETMSSYIHMLVNRIVASSPRQHELVLYDILYNFYRSAIAREKKTKVHIPEADSKEEAA